MTECSQKAGWPFGKRPFRAHIDPTEDDANVSFNVLDRIRPEMLNRVGLADLLKPGALVPNLAASPRNTPGEGS